jgi:hypothetical protein
MNTTENSQAEVRPEVRSVEINALVKRFAAHQKALGLSDGHFAGRYEKYLGSPKTWIKLKNGTWEGHVNEQRILGELQKFAEQLDGARCFDAAQFIPNLPYVHLMDGQLDRLLASPLDIRGLISLAPQGVGKSNWASAVMQRAANDPNAKYFYLRLLHSHREKSFQIACSIMEKLGGERTRNPGDMMGALVRHAQALGEFVLVLDEAHNGGIVLFNLLKDLIDETAVRFVYLGFPTEFDVITGKSSSAIGESRQTLRRCLQPICDEYRDGVMPFDVAAFLAAQGFKRGAEMRAMASEIQPIIAARYNLTTLAEAVREARKESQADGRELTLGMVTAAVKQLCSSAAQRRAAMMEAQSGK